MTNSDHNDFYIRSPRHPNYEEVKIIEEELINVIIQKLEMIIYSNTGDLYGDISFGSDLEYYLWETVIPQSEIKKKMEGQIYRHIPELHEMGYDLNIEVYDGTVRDIMYLKFRINAYNLNFVID